ncbi:MAG: permease YjgP/YjgQ family protein [Verrucomicrobia bacterium]|nr:permease YjgP/YjgQ family protein [Verrucomicrobiota bacterium]
MRVFNQSIGSPFARGPEDKTAVSSRRAGRVGAADWVLLSRGQRLCSASLNTYDRHLLREWLSILGIVLGAMVGLMLVQVMYDDFRVLRELGARGLEMWMYFFVTMPSFLANVLPVALLLSLLFVLGKLHRANEFTAMRAAGVSMFRITAPIWAVGVLACGLSWWLNSSVVPWSVETSRSLREGLDFRKQAQTLAADRVGVVESVAFDNQHAGRMWFFNRYSRLLHRGFGVTVSDLDNRRRETTRLVASEASYDEHGKGWIFKEGRTMSFNPESGEMIGVTSFTQETRSSYKEDPQLMLLIDRRPVDLSFSELKTLIDYLRFENSDKVTSYAVRYFTLIADTLGPLIVIAIAIPFAVSGVRVNPAVGVSKSFMLFFLYYILANLASSLATKQLIDPLFAAWLPNIGMTVLAAWLFVRLR